MLEIKSLVAAYGEITALHGLDLSIKKNSIVAILGGNGAGKTTLLQVMRHFGIQAVIAESFSPGFWRGEISMGFPLVACPGILKAVDRWHQLTVTWEAELIRNETTGRELKMETLSMADYKMLQCGGLIPYLKASIAEETKA